MRLQLEAAPPSRHSSGQLEAMPRTMFAALARKYAAQVCLCSSCLLRSPECVGHREEAAPFTLLFTALASRYISQECGSRN